MLTSGVYIVELHILINNIIYFMAYSRKSAWRVMKKNTLKSLKEISLISDQTKGL